MFRCAISSLLLPALWLVFCVGVASDSVAETQNFSLDPQFQLTLAKVSNVVIASNDEKAGRYGEALKGYNDVINTVASAIAEADRRGEARSSDMLLVLGAAHLDAARMEHELEQLGDANAYRQQQQRIDDHLLLAEKALTRALELEPREMEKIRAENQALPLANRRFIISKRWMIEENLGQVYARKGDAKAAREHFLAALKSKPDAERVKQGLVLLDLAEKRVSAEELEKKGWKIPAPMRDALKSPAAKETVVSVVKMGFGRAGPLWATIAGGVTSMAVDALQKQL